MADGVDAAERVGHDPRVADVADDQPDAVGQWQARAARRPVRGRQQGVEDDRLVARLDEGPDHPAPDEAGAAGDQDPHPTDPSRRPRPLCDHSGAAEDGSMWGMPTT